MLGGALGLAAFATIFNPTLYLSPMFDKILASLVIGGISMEAGAISQALTSNRGTSITTHQPASFRQIVRGCQRIGGITIYQSTTGSHHDQFNFIIVLAGHEIHAIENLYLDGRKVFWTNEVGSGWQNRNGYGFGGPASAGSHVGPGGATYDFGTLVYCEARYGDQVDGDVIGGMTANDPTWAATSAGSPWVGGCAYVYLKIEYDEVEFPNLPEIRFTVRGKNDIYDPRTGTRGYSENWALHVADALTDTQFGLGCDTSEVWNDQLIAAANVCDEQVSLAAGGSESRYTLHWHYDTSLSPGDVVAQMMPGAGGRLCRVGGEWLVYPAYYQGPSFEFDQNALTGDVNWTPQRSLRDRCNRVRGTYIASSYPYATSGNLYDSNGWYDNTIANTFPFAFQPTNFPEYACDVNHGYPSDQYLAQDGGVQLPQELALQTCLSIGQAQRVAKIMLMRNRQQGSGSLSMSLAAWQMMPLDVFYMDFPAMGWERKVLEITGTQFAVDAEDGGAPALRFSVTVQETDPSVYEWSVFEEQSVYAVPILTESYSSQPAPPTEVELISSAGTAVIGLDGSVTPRIEVTWVEPLDAYARQLQVQFRLSGTTTWIDAGYFDITAGIAFFGGVIAGQTYDVRVRSVRASGASSVWVEIDAFTVSLTFSTFAFGPLAPASLISEAHTDGTASIIVSSFQVRVGSVAVTVLPLGYTINALAQRQLYYVYYIDPTFTGGAVTPIATQNVADFQYKVGYFLIGSIVTQGTGSRLAPTAFNDVGDRTTTTPEAAYDGDTTTVATVSSSVTYDDSGDQASSAIGGGLWYRFPIGVTTADLTLTVIVSSVSGSYFSPVVSFSIGSVNTVMTSTDGANYTATIPSGTDLSTIGVYAALHAVDTARPDGSGTGTMGIAEIYLQ